tara:strand:- start:3619 stop:4155 length:537 start_codon:yes stop_codon:yes gene_type:complete
MGYTELFYIDKHGDAVAYKEYPNPWGGAAFIWTQIYDRFLKDHSKEFDSWLTSERNAQRLWNLVNDKDIPSKVRAVLAFTLDYAIVEYDKLPKMVEYLRDFLLSFPPGKNVVCHLGAWCDDMMEIYFREDDLGVCLYPTSVSENLWYMYDEEKDDTIRYNINKDDKHWFIFEEMGIEI